MEYREVERKEFIKYISKGKEKTLFYDIETLQFNEQITSKSPSLLNNQTFSCAVSYISNDCKEICYIIFPSFRQFLACFSISKQIRKDSSKLKTIKKINLVAHNGAKYDHHFLIRDLKEIYPDSKIENMELKQATVNEQTISIKEAEKIHKESKKCIILEKRIKSRNNLQCDIFFNGYHFVTEDSLLKTSMSLASLGEKMNKMGLVEKDILKTDFDYLRYNRSDNLSFIQAETYALDCFIHLTKEELIYIRNDVLLLALVYYNFEKMYPNFDIKKMTQTQNIYDVYNVNLLTSFQLKNEIFSGKDKKKLYLTDYQFDDMSVYDYIKSFYRGGLNMYNDVFVGEIIYDTMFSIDINSSYPYVMYNFKIPTYLTKASMYQEDTRITIESNENVYYLYKISKEVFNVSIIDKIQSKMVKKILVKYYQSDGDYIFINTYTIKMINMLTDLNITDLLARSYMQYECVDFGAKTIIKNYYHIKSQGKLTKKLIMRTPMDYDILDEDVDIAEIFTQEEIANAKLILNGIYGIPALRPFFNLFRRILGMDGTEMINIENGYENTQRNILFSTFVTSVAVYNLLLPLSYLTQQEIDENFVYCDTDSLYLKKAIFNKIPQDLFDPIALGKWDIENHEITRFYVLNHKKYSYFSNDINKKTGELKGIGVRSGGVAHESFNLNQTFESFINTEFSHGKKIKNKKSILNKNGVISIYQSVTKLEKGSMYPERFNSIQDILRKEIREKIKKEFNKDGFPEDYLYIETEYGTFSQRDIFPQNFPLKKNKTGNLIQETNKIKEYIK